jgi:hypothetical protein
MRDRMILRKIGAALAVLGLSVLVGAPSNAEELWVVRSGEAIFHFNVPLLRDLGIDLEVAGVGSDHKEIIAEEPAWAFPIRASSDLQFLAEHGIALSPGSVTGAARLDGIITLRDRATGKETRLTDLEIAHAAEPDSRPSPMDARPPLHLRSAATQLVFCELVHSMFDFRRKAQALQVHYLNARLTDQWARAMGRPDLAGWVVGVGEVRAGAKLLSSTPPSTTLRQPVFEGGFLDIGLAGLESIQQVAHAGSFPSGSVALSLVTTACNLGTVDVPWLRPMQEDHPVIHLALYRLLNGRFEQIGVSWMKHGFFAMSGTACSSCPNPSDGTFLAVGCSDIYGISNNSNRTYLGPRGEVNAYAATWECTGSHFAGGVPDCTRRHSSTGHGVLDHRLVAADADLANPGATYYYEAYYIVRGDQKPPNNWGSRRCEMNWSGSVWNFSTPGTNNPLAEGPALGRWGELSTAVDVAADDGQVLLAVQTTDLGGGAFHYEYSLLNLNSDRQIRSFSLPVLGVPNITNIGFHDNDANATNDWPVTVENGAITWQTDTYAQNPNANALVFGYLFNFRFDADAAPAPLDATLGPFKPGAGSEVVAATRGPTNSTTAVSEPGTIGRTRLMGVRPNPSSRGTTISYELATAVEVRLEIYDAAGRLVRNLVNANLGAGAKVVVWDGNTEDGLHARAGVYHVRLRAGAATSVKSMVVTN